MFFAIGAYEASMLWKFLDGISSAVSMRMSLGSPPAEENLTFLLCELLDANATSLHALSYPLSQLQTDLQTSDSGITVDVEFQTHEHSRYVESKYSGADLGIVLVLNHPLFGYSRRGILVQAKRLFNNGRGREYSLFSEYSSFHKKQADFLSALAQRFEVWNSIFYLWYNPPSTAFPEADAKVVKAYETSSFAPYQYWHRLHPFIDEMIEMGFPWALGGAGPRIISADEEAKAREWRQTQPALRFSGLEVARSVGEHSAPRLKSLYDAALDRHSVPAFLPFADFFLLALTSSRFGSDNPDWLRLTEGEKILIPKPKQLKDRSELDELESPPIPHHTLRITVRSTLPQFG